MSTPPIPATQLLTPPPVLAACRGCGCTEGEACPIRIDRQTVVPCTWMPGWEAPCSACALRLKPAELCELAFGEEAVVRIRAMLLAFHNGTATPLLSAPQGGSPR
ncbi:MAG TPA: hypothetical protein PLW65_26180 [Pseudomonadota bacterium]|nr:hypothetical protein [Pseudomonadota bacterium]